MMREPAGRPFDGRYTHNHSNRNRREHSRGNRCVGCSNGIVSVCFSEEFVCLGVRSCWSSTRWPVQPVPNVLRHVTLLDHLMDFTHKHSNRTIANIHMATDAWGASMGWFRCNPCIIRFLWYKSLLVDRLLACSTHTISYCHRNDT